MSVKARVSSLVSEARRDFTKTPVSASDSVQVKTAIGITYNALSETLLAFFKSTKNDVTGQPRIDTVEAIKNALYQSTRLTQWDFHDLPDDRSQWRIYASDDATYVMVDKKEILLHRGVRYFRVTDDTLVATTLFSALTQAQALVSPAVTPAVMSEEEQAEYFASDPTAQHYDIDASLAEPDDEVVSVGAYGTSSVTTDRDDADLMEEALIEDQHALDGPEPIVTVSQKFIDDISEAKSPRYAARMNRNSEIEKTEINSEYKDREPRKSCPQTENTLVIARLKSLQGRILNIMEASFSEKTQREAVKTLINKEFRREMNRVGSGWSVKDEE